MSFFQLPTPGPQWQISKFQKDMCACVHFSLYSLIFLLSTNMLWFCLFVKSSTLLWGEGAVRKSEPTSAVNRVILRDPVLPDHVLVAYNSGCLRCTNLRSSRPPRPAASTLCHGVSEVTISVTRKSTGKAEHTVLQGCVRQVTVFEVLH